MTDDTPRGRLSTVDLQVDKDDDITQAASEPRLRFHDYPSSDDRYITDSRWGSAQRTVDRLLNHLAFRLFTILMIVVDLVVVIVDLCEVGNRDAVNIATLVIVLYFFTEVNVRLIVKGWRKLPGWRRSFFSSWVDVVDYVIVTISVICTVIAVWLEASNHVKWTKLLVVGRLVRVVLVLRVVSERRQLARATRLAVSQNKRRYQQDGFDLDLVYITDRVIAMSFPSSGLMAIYRNPIKEVARFFHVKHKDHFKIYNLCSERMYDETLFGNNVERIMVDDHNVPKLTDMLAFAKSAADFLDADLQNVIALHCKGGKGRTGTMVCVTLIEIGQFSHAQASLEYFGERRTDKSVGATFQGVETPSQSRYVGYFEKIQNTYGGRLPPEQKLLLDYFVIKNVKGLGAGDGSDLTVRVITDRHEWRYAHALQTECKVAVDKSTNDVTFEIKDRPCLCGDIKIMVDCSSKYPKGYDSCAFYFWFHTSFIYDLTLEIPREELDNPHKERTWTVYQDGFAAVLYFSRPTS